MIWLILAFLGPLYGFGYEVKPMETRLDGTLKNCTFHDLEEYILKILI